MAGLGDSSAPLVFVSSTVEDFRDLRSALRFWLDSLGYRRFMSEFSGSDKVLGPGSYDACFDAIRRADLYVLLIGTRRGSLISKEPKRSITEAEYDFAYQLRRETGRPKLLFFVRDEIARDIRRDNPELEYQDIEHTGSFIDKVERVAETNAAREGEGDSPADNWLHRFKEFDEIATEIDSALGITGSVREARQLDLLREELAEVLQTFVGTRTMSFQEYFDVVPKVRDQIEEVAGRPIRSCCWTRTFGFLRFGTRSLTVFLIHYSTWTRIKRALLESPNGARRTRLHHSQWSSVRMRRLSFRVWRRPAEPVFFGATMRRRAAPCRLICSRQLTMHDETCD